MKKHQNLLQLQPSNHHSLILFLWIFLSSLQTVCFIEKETYQTQIDCGYWSEPITAVHEQWTDPAQHFLCGYAVREMKWQKTLYNCNCGNRIDIPGVISYKCDWCENTFWTMRNGFKAIFCSINNWSNQITKIYETGSVESRNWKEYKCPKGFYVKQVAGRLGTEQERILGLTGMQMVCSNLEQTQTVKVQDTLKYTLQEPSENGVGTFVSAVQIKSEKAGKLTGIKWIFEGIAYIKQAEIIGSDQIRGKSTQKTIQIIPLPKGDILKKVKVPLTTSLSINYVWLYKNSYYYGYRVGDINLKPLRYQMEKDEGLYKPIYPKVNFNVTQTAKYIPTSPVYATINPSSNVTAYTVFQQLEANVTSTIKVRFFDKTTQEFIVEKTIESIYSGAVEGPISIFFEQKKCIGGWGKNNLIINGGFEQNKCIRSEQWCIWDQTSISNSLPGWIPNPFIQIGRGNIYSNLFGDTWIVQLYIYGKPSCMKQKLILGPGLYSLSFDRTATNSNPLASNSLEVKFDGNSLKKIYPEDYFIHTENIQIKLTQPIKDYWLEICAIGTGANTQGVILDNFKMSLYYECATVETTKY